MSEAIHILAIPTYGSQRVTDPHTRREVSAYKMGYSSASAPLLLALYGDSARDVSSVHASYIYVQILSEAVVHGGFLLLKLTAEELTRAESVSRRYARAGAYVWRDEAWWELPSERHADYSQPLSRSAPDYSPLRYRPVSPSSGERESVVKGIQAERSQRSAHETPWWWLTGDTYPHRELLKRWGCRWGNRRRAWYYVGWELPPALQALVTATNAPEPVTGEQAVSEADEPCSLSEASALLGVVLTPERNPALDVPIKHTFSVGERVYYLSSAPQETDAGRTVRRSAEGQVLALHNHLPQALVDFGWAGQAFVEEVQLSHTRPPLEHRYALGETVYLAHSLRVANQHKLPMDSRGVVVRRYAYQEGVEARYRLAYAVKFEGYGEQTLFEGSLSAEATQLKGIEQHEVVPVMLGVRAEDAIQHEVDKRQRIPDSYHLLDALEESSGIPETIDAHEAPQVQDEALPLDGEIEQTAPTESLEVPTKSRIRHLPASLPDAALSAALAQIPATPSPSRPTHTGLARISQNYVGELTGSITGAVYCYGYAVHEGTLIYLNMGGARMAVEAIRAKLSKGESVNLLQWDAPSLELTAGEGQTGKYQAYTQVIPSAKFSSQILCHEWWVKPQYGGLSTTFIWRTSEAQAIAQLYQHIHELVSVAVFEAWGSYLYQAGQVAQLLRPTRSAGGVDLLAVTLDADAWLRLISGGLSQKRIHLPESV